MLQAVRLAHFSKPACLNVFVFFNMVVIQADWYDWKGFRNVWDVMANVVVGMQ